MELVKCSLQHIHDEVKDDALKKRGCSLKHSECLSLSSKKPPLVPVWLREIAHSNLLPLRGWKVSTSATYEAKLFSVSVACIFFQYQGLHGDTFGFRLAAVR